ncbi:MAG: hypothetical protein P1U34_04230 [Coxiellaceae bacterium]|nr:hypothetical protein [Coxiellaceae bacterium]
MNVTLHFSDIDPSHKYHKISCSFNKEKHIALMLNVIREKHNYAMERFRGVKADKLNLYTLDGRKVEKANIMDFLLEGKDITLTVRPRRHRHPAAGIFNIRPHCIKLLYGSPVSDPEHSLAAYHKAGSERELALKGSWETDPPTYFTYMPSALPR